MLVDECQDLTQTQLALIQRAAGARGRLLFVGDPEQAIMRFRGADNDSIRNIQASLRPVTLPLTVSFRCPASHVRLATDIMPDIRAAGAPEGRVIHQEWRQVWPTVQEQDLLFARSRKLTQRVALELFAHRLRLDCPLAARGGAEEQSSARMDIVRVLREQARVFVLGAAPAAEPGSDAKAKSFILWVLRQLHHLAPDPREFRAFIQRVTEPDPLLGVRVCTAHQVRGLEADRVSMMGLPKFAATGKQQRWEVEQEEHLRRVALTRAQDPAPGRAALEVTPHRTQ